MNFLIFKLLWLPLFINPNTRTFILMLCDFLMSFVRVSPPTNLALKSSLFILLRSSCFPPANAEIVILFKSNVTKSHREITLILYFAGRSSKAGASAINWLRRLLPSVLSSEPSGFRENSVCLNAFLIFSEETSLIAFPMIVHSFRNGITGIDSFYLLQAWLFVLVDGILP